MLVRSIVYGLMAHLIIGWAFLYFIRTRAPRVAPPLIPVQIHIEEKPLPGRSSPRATGPAARAVEPATSGASPVTLPPSYTELLPKATAGQIPLPEATEDAGEGALIPGHRFKPGSSGTTKQNLLIDASILSAALDVPLKARRISSGASAFVRLVQTEGRGLRIVDLRGDPMLRAVIYENLHEPRVIALILQLMDELQETSLPLSLEALTLPSGRMQDEDDYSWIGRRLIIRKSAPPEWKAPAGALALPDEDAKKAVIRDRLEWERLQRSPAYRSAIHNYDLPTAENP